MSYSKNIQHHYETIWENKGSPQYWLKGPVSKLNKEFCVLEFAPTVKRKMWTYATCCMSSEVDSNPVELHLFSAKQDKTLVELMTMVAYFHKTANMLDLNHTFYIGKPWQKNSICDHGFISLPYMDGPNLEFGLNKKVKFYWIIPISKKEVEFKKANGVEKLEEKFEELGIDYIYPERKSLI